MDLQQYARRPFGRVPTPAGAFLASTGAAWRVAFPPNHGRNLLLAYRNQTLKHFVQS